MVGANAKNIRSDFSSDSFESPQRSVEPFLWWLSLGIRFYHISPKTSSGEVWEGMGTAGCCWGCSGGSGMGGRGFAAQPEICAVAWM